MNLMSVCPPLISLEVLKSGSLAVCQSGSLAVVFRGIDGIERSSVAVVVSGICGSRRGEGSLTRRRAGGSADYYY